MVYNCNIDGVNVGERYGVFISKGGYDNILCFPAMKAPDQNDWSEEDGIEADLSDPHLEALTAEITFVVSGTQSFVGDFIEFVTSPGRHNLRIESLKRSWVVRVVSNQDVKDYRGYNVTGFSLQFSVDRPVIPVAIGSPAGGGLEIPVSAYEIDGISLDQFGIFIEEGRDEVLKMPAIKKTLSSSYRTEDGIEYDADLVKFSSKDVTLKGCFIASDITRFWTCYDSFFGLLVQSGMRTMFVDYMGEEYPCFYKTSKDFSVKALSDYVIVSFSVTLVFAVFRIGAMDYLLSSEVGELIVLEEDGETCIDMKIYAN